MSGVRIGSATLSKQIGGRGAFARIRIEVTPCEQGGELVVAPDACVDRYFLPAVEAGIAYAWDRLLYERRSPLHVRVRLLELATMTCDTTVMMVVYVSALALCDALGTPLNSPPSIDADHRTITFVL